jgi:hypothetical protein
VLEGEEFKTPVSSLSPNLSLESADLQGSFHSSLQPRVIHQAPSSILSATTDGGGGGGIVGDHHAGAKDDEHDIIARLCRVLAKEENSGEFMSEGEAESDSICGGDEVLADKEVEKKIKQLEEENRHLTEEHDGTYKVGIMRWS